MTWMSSLSPFRNILQLDGLAPRPKDSETIHIKDKLGFKQRVRGIFYETGAFDLLSGGLGATSYLEGVYNGKPELLIAGLGIIAALPLYKALTIKAYRSAKYGQTGHG